MTFCGNCGTEVAAESKFCAKCGTAVPGRGPIVTSATEPLPNPTVAPIPVRVTEPVAPSGIAEPVSSRSAGPIPTRGPLPKGSSAPRNRWWLGPGIVVGVVLIAWLLLAGLPFRRDATIEAGKTPAIDTIGEGTAVITPTETPVDGTTSTRATDTFEVTEIQLPPNQLPPTTATFAEPAPATQTIPPPMTSAQPPVTSRPPAARPPAATRPVTTRPPAVTRPPVLITRPPVRATPPPPEPVQQEISEQQASAALRRHIVGNDTYNVAEDCLQFRSTGYSNEGFGFQIWDTCAGGGASQRLGVWRVDSKTREVFVRGSSGRYVRP